jgi:hypothetical protein
MARNETRHQRKKLDSITRGWPYGATASAKAIFPSLTCTRSFRVSFPATIMFIVFAAGVFLAATVDWFVYRYALKPAFRFIGFENHPFLSMRASGTREPGNRWAALSRFLPAVSGGLMLAIPIWGGWRCAKAKEF